MADRTLDERGEPRTRPDEHEQIEMAKQQRKGLPRTDPTDSLEFEGDTVGDPSLETPTRSLLAETPDHDAKRK